MEARLDPEKVREAMKRLAEAEAKDWLNGYEGDIRLLLAVLSEGRAASTPFASIGSEMTAENGWHERDELVIEAAEGAVATIASVPVAAFRALAAFNELVSQEKPDGG